MVKEKRTKKESSKKSDVKESTSPRAEKKMKREDSALPEIDVKGKPIRLAPGGSVHFECVECRVFSPSSIFVSNLEDVAKKPEKWQVVCVVGGKKVEVASEEKSNLFHDPPQVLSLTEDTEEIKVVLNQEGLLGHTYKGEVRVSVDELLDGYPRDAWFKLVNKPGKKNDKIKGELHLRLLYYAPEQKPTHDEFKHPLHSLILKKRLDIFQRKIDDVEKDVDTLDEASLTPLLLAASRGQTAFVKLLVDNGAKPAYKDSKGMTALHHAAVGGHVDVLNYLARLSEVDVNAADGSDLGNTPLHLAAENNKGEAVEMLWKRHAKIDKKNAKGDTPLSHALAVQSGATSSVTALVKAGANIYIKNKDDLSPWEISQRKDICYSASTRSAFIKACDVVDWREFEILESFSKKQRFTGENLTSDWRTATQFKLSVKKDMKVSILVYPEKREEGAEKKVSACIIRHDPRPYAALSFQQEGIGFASSKPFEFNMDKEYEYTIVSFTSTESLEGKFGVCVFSNDSTGVQMVEPKQFKRTDSVKGKWKGPTAAGTLKPLQNPLYQLTVDGEGEVDVAIMLTQDVKDVGGALFGDSGARITPAKYYLGFFIYDKTCNKLISKTPVWLNSVDVHHTFKLDGGKQYTLVPATEKENEELSFTLFVGSPNKVSIKLKKGN